MRTPRVYVDMSVFGGVADPEFADASRRFFEQVGNGRFRVVISAHTADEVEREPDVVRTVFTTHVALGELIAVPADAVILQRAYVAAGVVSERNAASALHVAVATIAGCDMVVSWDFRNVVHFRKVAMYNEVNREHELPEIAIYSPLAVIEPYDDDDEDEAAASRRRKPFDCVEFQHEAGARLMRETAGMSRDELVEYWKRRSEALIREIEERRKKSSPGA